MADGDVVHSGLKRLYQKPYEWICEGKASNEDCARSILDALRTDLKRKGDLPIKLCQHIAEILAEPGMDFKELEAKDYADLNQKIDVLARGFNLPSYLKELVLYVSKGVLSNHRYSQAIHCESIAVEILHRYVHAVYAAEFLERIALNPRQPVGISLESLTVRIEQIKPLIENGISAFAKTLAKYHSSAKLSLPRRSAKLPIDLDEDISF
jgi:hypothetical protein